FYILWLLSVYNCFIVFIDNSRAFIYESFIELDKRCACLKFFKRIFGGVYPSHAYYGECPFCMLMDMFNYRSASIGEWLTAQTTCANSFNCTWRSVQATSINSGIGGDNPVNSCLLYNLNDVIELLIG